MKPNFVIVITGPTATGKTALGVELSLLLGGEVISADSMQIYRGMDIGTAKPSPGELRGVPHHMFDVAEPSENFSVARYVEMASLCADGILSRGKLPIIVGGTGLWIDSLLRGNSFAEAPEDKALRKKLSLEYDVRGGDALLQNLRAVDPERAEKLSPADKRRIVRALEIWELTGKTMTEHDEENKKRPPRYESFKYALTFSDREALYARIGLRVDMMMKAGLFDEVRGLLSRGLSESSTAMQAIGYKEAAGAINGTCSEEEAAELIKRSTRRYAKRQLTWLRRDPSVRWMYMDNLSVSEAARLVSTEISASQR